MDRMNRDREIERLAIAHVPPQAIAARISVPVETVYGVISRARRAGVHIPRFPTSRSHRPSEARSRTVVVSADVLDALADTARARGITVNALARQLLGIIADDGLAPAILDDGDDR